MKKVTLITERNADGIVTRTQIVIPKKADICAEEVTLMHNGNGKKTISLTFDVAEEQFKHIMSIDILPRDEVYHIMNACDEAQEKKILEYARMIYAV